MDKRDINLLLAAVLLILLNIGTAPYSRAESPMELFNQGVDALKTGDPQKAVDLFTELIMAEPGNAKGFKNRGVALLKLGKVDLSIQDFERALQINPDLPGIYSNLGAAWYYKQAYEKAVINYSSEIERTPGSYISYFNRALSRMQLDQQMLAMVDIQRCLELKPGFSGALQLQEMLPGFEIQAGAFLDQNNAVKMRHLLSAKGVVDAHTLTIADHNQRTWYLVRFALFNDENEAQLFCKRFVEQGSVKALVRPWGKF